MGFSRLNAILSLKWKLCPKVLDLNWRIGGSWIGGAGILYAPAIAGSANVRGSPVLVSFGTGFVVGPVDDMVRVFAMLMLRTVRLSF